jgi:hypothetical protein
MTKLPYTPDEMAEKMRQWGGYVKPEPEINLQSIAAILAIVLWSAIWAVAWAMLP